MPAPTERPASLPVLAELWRGGIRESVHHGAWVEVDSAGRVLSAVGDPEYVTTMRSAAKPIQALPLLSLPGFQELEIRSEELAICCASHAGEPRHCGLAASVLSLSGYLPDNLVCGPAGHPPSPLKHGCSGNHAAILLIAHLLGATLEGYHRPGHPAQTIIHTKLQEMSRTKSIVDAQDACGIPTFGLTLSAIATSFARLAQAGPIPEAMMAHPELIGPSEHFDTQIMRAFPGRIVAKTGAEGLLCLGLFGQDKGMAVKIGDGNPRSLGVVTLAAMRQAGWITDEEYLHEELSSMRCPLYYSSTGEAAAELRLRRDSFTFGIGDM